MNPNLVLTPVVDKNGVSTTRWAKPATASQTPAKSIPPVPSAVPQRPSRVELLESLSEAIAEHGDHEEFDTDETLGCLKLVSSDHALWLLGEFIQKDGEINDERVTLAADILYNYHLAPEKLNPILFYFDVFEERWDTRFNEDAVLKLPMCTEVPAMEDYSLADEDTQHEIRRLLKSAESYYADGYQPANPEHNIILGEELRSLIESSPEEDRVRIKAIMTERSTEDVELIKDIMNADSPALSSGML